MKSIKKVVIFIIIILAIVAIHSYCSAKTVVVNTDALKLRKEPNTESTVLELVSQNQELEYIEETQDGWCKVTYNGITGYVSKQYVTIKEEEQTPPEEPVTTPQEPEKGTEYKTKEMSVKTEIDAYILPLINSNKIGKLKKDSKVIVINELNGWAYIQTDEINAWIRSDSMQEIKNSTPNPQEPSTPEPNKQKPTPDTSTNTTNKEMYVKESSIYVRSGPGTNYQVVETLILNDKVTVVGEEKDWYQVKVNNKTGYIANWLLSDTRTETTARGEANRTQINQEPTPQVVANEDIETNTSTGQKVVDFAKQYLGCKYVYGAAGPNSFDCSGFTMYVYKNFGISLSHSATAQSKKGTAIAKENLQPGDLVFFKDYETMNGIGHCGIYIGEGNFIHASSGTGYCVKISTLLSGSYKTRYETARRIL